MHLLKSEKTAALVILFAAVAGFVLANSALAHDFEHFADTKLSIGISLSVESWISELGLAFFFLLIGIELKHEFTHGSFKNTKHAISPLIAALLGVIFPAVFYALANLSDESSLRGWAIPTATDVTFAMAIFLLFGKRLGKSARTYLLTIVVADDLIAIGIIAVVFPQSLNLWFLLAAIPCAYVFWLVTRSRVVPAIRIPASVLLGLAIWLCVLESGIHPVIAGVLIGVLLPEKSSKQVEKIILLPTNLLILPIFAALSAAVSVSGISNLGGVFFGILIGPIGKILGIALGGWLGYKLAGIPETQRLSLGALSRLGALGGIGFTVSLLVAQLSFRGSPELLDEAIFAVLVTSVLTMVVGSVALATAKRPESTDRS